MRKKRYVKTKGEGLLKTLTVIFFVGFLLSTFVLSAKIQSSNLDNALEVADANNLKYNNNNIRVISK